MPTNRQALRALWDWRKELLRNWEPPHVPGQGTRPCDRVEESFEQRASRPIKCGAYTQDWKLITAFPGNAQCRQLGADVSVLNAKDSHRLLAKIGDILEASNPAGMIECAYLGGLAGDYVAPFGAIFPLR